MKRKTTSVRAMVAAMAAVGAMSAAGYGQFVPDQPAGQPPAQPGTTPAQPAPADPNAPQTPGGAPAGAQTFPGPRGTTITFPTGLYDEKAVATEQIAEARRRARDEGKRVLVMWGENRCGFCVFLNDMLKTDPAVAPLVKAEYVWIKIDIGKFDKNIDIANFYNTPLMEQGFGAPALTVIDPVTDRALDRRGGNSMTAKPMTMSRVFDEKVVAEFLSAHRAPAKVAQTILNDALAEAKKDQKAVLAYFVTPGSEDAEALDAWVKKARSETALGKNLAVARLDTQRMIGGAQLLKKAAGTDAAAAPFIVLLDSEGNSLGADTMLTNLPTSEGEIKQFEEMLKKHAPKMTDAERAAVMTSLKQPAAGEAKTGG